MNSKAGEIDIDIREVEEGVEVLVSDNGRGIPESIREKLFDPFVSYGKENGTGLGLTVVQKIIQDHGGDIEVERTSPQGTTFKFRLPLASGERVSESAGQEKLLQTKTDQTE